MQGAAAHLLSARRARVCCAKYRPVRCGEGMCVCLEANGALKGVCTQRKVRDVRCMLVQRAL